MRTVFVLLLIGLFTYFIFLSRRGTYHFAHVIFFFFFSPLVVWNELASPGKMLWWCDHGSMAAIYLGIGHITGSSVGDQVHQIEEKLLWRAYRKFHVLWGPLHHQKSPRVAVFKLSGVKGQGQPIRDENTTVGQ